MICLVYALILTVLALAAMAGGGLLVKQAVWPGGVRFGGWRDQPPVITTKGPPVTFVRRDPYPQQPYYGQQAAPYPPQYPHAQQHPQQPPPRLADAFPPNWTINEPPDGR